MVRSLVRSVYASFARMFARKHLYLVEALTYLPVRWKYPMHVRDFNRYGMLELVEREIRLRAVPGSVAELGVYRGDFASHINRVFPDRTLYLFDTFGGFDARDVSTERARSLSDGKQDFSDTSVELVLGKMEHRDRCVVRKGFFPETAEGIDDQFAFVSLDADLFEPILAGLKFFYPRLSPGGYIFIHDFNNAEYPGAREAVTSFCKEHNIGFVPLADSGGTAVLCK
jgi:O-methyltransferase